MGVLGGKAPLFFSQFFEREKTIILKPKKGGKD